MRLTLRTLMAYLDDVLEPADTKIIGLKIQESPMAQLLVSRIRDVMRRRRLKAPEVFGPEMGIDPNIVAQYLDTTLPAERYADVERVLLASDEMLAEAAACHQVLPVWLANPVEVSPASRDRLYALGPVDVSSQLSISSDHNSPAAKLSSELAAERNGNVSLGDINSERSRDGVTTTVPDYLKRTPWYQRLIPSSLIALLVIACCGLLAPGIMTGLRQAKNEIQLRSERDKGGPPSSPDIQSNSIDSLPKTIETESQPTNPMLASSTAHVGSQVTKLPRDLDPAPPKDDFDETTVPPPAPTANSITVSASSDNVAQDKSAKPSATPDGASAIDLASVPRITVADVPISYASNEGVLLHFDVAQQRWFMVPHRSVMKPGELLANIEPFETVLDFERGSLKATLLGETVVNLLKPIEAGAAGIDVRRGRLLFQGGRSDENNPSRIGIAIGDDLWKLDLLSQETLVGLEVTHRESTQFQKLQESQWYQASLYVISGSVKWTTRAGKFHEIGDHMALNISPEKDQQIRSNPISFSVVPDWCDSAKRKALPLRKHQSQVLFEKAFELDQPVDASMITLVKNTKFPKIAELAAQCLSATDNYSALVETLAECQHEEARFAARDGLRRWLPLHPDRGLKLMKELELFYPPAEADAIYQMLWGFSREDVTSSKSNSWLFMNWMRSPKPEIRELADYWVERLTGRKTEYRALGGTAAQRESQIHRMEDQIERNNGLIKAP